MVIEDDMADVIVTDDEEHIRDWVGIMVESRVSQTAAAP